MKTLTFYSGKLWHSDKPFPVREHFHSLSFEDNQKLYLNHIKENWLSTAYEVVNPEVIPNIVKSFDKMIRKDGRTYHHFNDGDHITLPKGYGIRFEVDSRTLVNCTDIDCFKQVATITLPEKPELSSEYKKAQEFTPLITTVEPSESQEETLGMVETKSLTEKIYERGKKEGWNEALIEIDIEIAPLFDGVHPYLHMTICEILKKLRK